MWRIWDRATTGFGVLIAVVAILGAAAVVSAAVETHFDANLEGWQVTGDNAAAWSATAGNPGGCLSVNDLATGNLNWIVAPAAYLGDWSGLTAADSLSFDYYFQNTSGGALLSPAYTVRILGPGGEARAMASYVPPQLAWTRVTVSLSPADWTLVSGTWSELLAHVYSLTLAGEFVNGDEVVRLDNVRLTGNVGAAFEACAGETFTVAGLGDWSFQDTGGITNPGSGGNSGGFCQISDASNISYAVAPARYLGDWSPLDGYGCLTIDLRILSSGGTTIDVAEFIRLSGPGGTATVPMPAAALPPVGRAWKTFAFPLQPAAWTVTAGTWAGLLANVTECRIQMEFIDGSETVGFDNFGRLSAACPPLDMPVIVHVPEATLRGHRDFVGISTVALNPADGLLYGTVDVASASGGGLYALEGSTLGTRLQAYELPAHLIYDADGNAFITEDNSGNVYRRAAAGGSTLWVSGFHAGDDDPCGLCFAPPGFDGPNVDPGDILVSDFGNLGADEIWAFSAAAAENERLVLPDPGEKNYYDIATGPDGVVYVADALDAGALSVLSPTGTIAPLSLGTPLTGMVGIVYDDGADRIYTIERTGHTLNRIDPASGDVELVASGFVSLSACGIEIDAANRLLWVVDVGGNRVYEFRLGSATAVADDPSGTLRPSALMAWPNPARSGASISFAVAREANARLEIYDLAGRLVRRLVEERLPAGERTVRWDGRDATGRRMASGTYLVRLVTGQGVLTGKVTLTK